MTLTSRRRQDTGYTRKRRSLTLWGYKPGVVTEPVELAEGTSAMQRFYRSQGWRTAIVRTGEAPEQFRRQVAQQSADRDVVDAMIASLWTEHAADRPF